MNIWKMTSWKKNPELQNAEIRSGLRFRFDAKVNAELREGCIEFAKWLRKNYVFPVRVVVYVKSQRYVKARDGELVYGTFLRTEKLCVEPYIRISTGDYAELVDELGTENAVASINHCIAHELTHYYQWLNNLDLKLTMMGEERQANKYADSIIDEYEASKGYFRTENNYQTMKTEPDSPS